jgi:hypothetical protein
MRFQSQERIVLQTTYSIGFLRYEKDEEDDNSCQQQIWEHYWDLSSSVEGFDNRHLLVHISGMNQTYFNGGGHHHQGMLMATPQRLVAWNNDPRIVISTRHGFQEKKWGYFVKE